MKLNIIFIILSVLVLISTIMVIGYRQTFVYKARASVISTSFSVSNSYLFVSPLRAAVNNKEKIRVTIIILNDQGLGVANKHLVMQTDNSLTIEAIQGTTDNRGKAIFDIYSNKAGEFYLQASADGVLLNQTAHLTFY